MKFNYKDTKTNTIMEVKSFEPCFICGENTKWIDYCSEQRICSRECMKELDRRVIEHENKY